MIAGAGFSSWLSLLAFALDFLALVWVFALPAMRRGPYCERVDERYADL